MRAPTRLGLIGLSLLVLGVSAGGIAHAQAPPSYLLFDSLPTRPIAMSRSGEQLFVLDTPDNHLEIYDVEAGSGETFQLVGSPLQFDEQPSQPSPASS